MAGVDFGFSVYLVTITAVQNSFKLKSKNFKNQQLAHTITCIHNTDPVLHVSAVDRNYQAITRIFKT